MKENGRVIFKENNQFLLGDQFRHKEEITEYESRSLCGGERGIKIQLKDTHK